MVPCSNHRQGIYFVFPVLGLLEGKEKKKRKKGFFKTELLPSLHQVGSSASKLLINIYMCEILISKNQKKLL